MTMTRAVLVDESTLRNLSKFKEMCEENEKLKEENESLRATKELLYNAVKHWKNECNKAIARVRAASSYKEYLNSCIVEVQNDLKKVRIDHYSIKKSLKDKDNEIAALKEENEKLRNAARHWKKRCWEMAAIERDYVRRFLEEKDNETAALNCIIKDLRIDRENLRADKDSAEAELRRRLEDFNIGLRRERRRGDRLWIKLHEVKKVFRYWEKYGETWLWSNFHQCITSLRGILNSEDEQ
jgi:chromosome segregation ATPase